MTRYTCTIQKGQISRIVSYASGPIRGYGSHMWESDECRNQVSRCSCNESRQGRQQEFKHYRHSMDQTRIAATQSFLDIGRLPYTRSSPYAPLPKSTQQKQRSNPQRNLQTAG